jgi:hypothetical protein
MGGLPIAGELERADRTGVCGCYAAPMRVPLLLALVAVSACNKAADVATDTPPVTATSDAGTPSGFELSGTATDVDARFPAAGPVTRLVVVWDARRDGESFPLKYGEGTLQNGHVSVKLADLPPDAVLVDGAVGVGHLMAVPTDAVIPDGELSLDDADALLASALGGASGTSLVYRADSSQRLAWADAFPFGVSCAAPGSGGFVPADCAQETVAMRAARADGALPFTAWQPPPGDLPRSDD